MEHHFVICYNDESNKWFVDVNTAMLLFEDLGYWHNPETGEWVSTPTVELEELYLHKEEALSQLLEWAQGE